MESNYWKIIAVVAVIILLGLGITGIIIGIQYSNHPNDEGIYKGILYAGLAATFIGVVTMMYILLRVYSTYETNVMAMQEVYRDLNQAYIQSMNGQSGYQQFANQVGSAIGGLDYCLGGICSVSNI